jgi:hypothetical protein
MRWLRLRNVHVLAAVAALFVPLTVVCSPTLEAVKPEVATKPLRHRGQVRIRDGSASSLSVIAWASVRE